MSEILLLRLSPDADRCAWQRVDRLGNLLGPAREGSLAQAADAARGAQVHCVVPQEALRSLSFELPVKDRRRAHQAALFALEEHLLSPLDDAHVAQADRARDGRWAVAAVSAPRMRVWMEALREVGLEPARMLPETELLPDGDGLRVLWEAGRVLAVTVDGAGVTCAPAQAAQVLPRLATASARVTVWSAPGQDPGPALADLGVGGTEVEHQSLDREVVALYAEHARDRRDALDLMQGEYRSRSAAGREGLGAWVWAGAAAALLLTVQLGAWISEIAALRAQEAALLEDMQSVWQQAMGPSARFDRYQARSRMEIALRSAGDGGDAETDRLLRTLTAVAGASAGRQVRLDGVALAPGSLQIQVRAPDVSTLQQLADGVQQRAGATVEIGDVTSGDQDVAAQLSIRFQGAG